jgi:anti-sigma B factor antagonist
MEPPAELLVVERSPGLFRVVGEIDAATAPRLSELSDRHGPLRFDLSGVTFIDSSGIAVLVGLYQRCAHDGCSFQVVDCSPQVEHLLHIVDLHQRFTQPPNDPPHSRSGPLAPQTAEGLA